MNELFDQITAIAKAQNKSIMAGIELGRDESAKRIKRLEATNAVLLEVLEQIISDLPTNRDWLSPDLEREAKQLIKKAEE